MAENAAKLANLRAPNGSFPAKVDAAGRIKLPVKFQEYLEKLPDPSMFATFNGRNMAKIYVNGSWERMKEILNAPGKSKAAAQSLLRVSNFYGADVELDSNGRVTLPQELRGKLNLKDSPVQLQFFGEVIHIYHSEELTSSLAADELLVNQAEEELAELGVQ